MRKIDPSNLPFGKGLVADVFDAQGDLFMSKGQIIERADLMVYRQRLAGGLFVADDTGPTVHSQPQTQRQPRSQPQPQSRSQSQSRSRSRSQSRSRSRSRSQSQPATDVAPSEAPGAQVDPAAAPMESFTDEHGRRIIPVQSLQVGQSLAFNLLDDRDVLLLRRGQTISESFLARLLNRRVLQLVATDDESARKSPTASELDRLATAGKIEQPTITPVSHSKAHRLKLPALREAVGAAQASARMAVDEYAQVMNDAMRGRPIHVAGARHLLDGLFESVQQDLSLTPLILDLRAAPGGEYLFQHGVNCALMAMSVAQRLGFSPAHCMNAGMGALFQDVGMMRVPLSIRMAPRQLTPDERAEIERHPIYTLDMLEKVGELDQRSWLVAYQAHERCDGSGYPCRRSQHHIHPLARIVAVADAFCALTGDRPHRTGVLPYDAITNILHEGHGGRFDRQIVRAMIDFVSLFPVGSFVKLSTGQTARVLRSNGSTHTRPIVVPLNLDGSETDVELDLSRAASVRVVEALAGPKVDDKSTKPQIDAFRAA